MSTPSFIILTGFMGTGKTVVGKRLAKRLSYLFLDSDSLIEQREQQCISEIFAKCGEAVFRQIEKQVIADLCQAKNTVLAIGGGALLDPGTRERLKNAGTLVLLKADPQTLVKRLKKDQSRPLLQGTNLQTKIETLLKQRQAVYEEIPIQIDTTGLRIEAVVDKILQALYSGDSSPIQAL